MADVFTSERAFEDVLVSVLEKDFGWKNGTLEHPSEQDLLDNWAQILFENNRGRNRLRMTYGWLPRLQGGLPRQYLRRPI